MINLVFPAALPVVVPVTGGGFYPVRRIFCVGRNYADHVREMGNDPDRAPPVFFTKPADALLCDGADMPYPPQTNALHYEVELVVALQSGGSALGEADALRQVFGYAAGLDMTRRDIQDAAKKVGAPWDMGKAFDHSAPIGAIAPASEIGHPLEGAITLEVNGHIRQSSTLDQMIYAVPEIIAHLSRFVELKAGDLIFTGTPAGVGAVVRGDRLCGEIAGIGAVTTQIV